MRIGGRKVTTKDVVEVRYPYTNEKHELKKGTIIQISPLRIKPGGAGGTSQKSAPVMNTKAVTPTKVMAVMTAAIIGMPGSSLIEM